jgi:hypothetical protein
VEFNGCSIQLYSMRAEGHSCSVANRKIKNHMKFISTLSILALLLSVAGAEQGGSFFLSDIDPLLNKQRSLWDAIQSSFEIHSVGDASRISQSDNPKLAGIRIGPYELWAKPKGAPGAFIFKIEIQTEILFYDNANKPVQLKSATELKETIIAIRIRPLPKSDYFEP